MKNYVPNHQKVAALDPLDARNHQTYESDSDELSSEGFASSNTTQDGQRHWKTNGHMRVNKSNCYHRGTKRTNNYHHHNKHTKCGGSSTLSSSSLSSTNEGSTADSNRFRILKYDQVLQLHNILNEELAIHSRLPEMPTIRMKLKDFFQALKRNLEKENIKLRDIRFNGGLASHVISLSNDSHFNDIDVLLSVDLSSCPSTMNRVKSIVQSVLMSFLSENSEIIVPNHCVKTMHSTFMKSSTVSPVISPANSNSSKSLSLPRLEDGNNLIYKKPSDSTSSLFLDDYLLQESYIFKQFRMFSQEADCWSLLALGCPTPNSKVVELKFVDRMKRQYEFTVDSFQIQLDSLLSFYNLYGNFEFKPNFYPTVVAESVSGSFQEALHHLNEKLIVTYSPESIRGGGLLKYCKLIVDGYRPGDEVDLIQLEKYMSSRFFIDFNDLNSQRIKLESYLSNHFQPHDEETMIKYLTTFFNVVNGSTVCLMSQDHYNILETVIQLIHVFINRIQTRGQAIRLDAFSNAGLNNSQDFALDRIYYGDQYFPMIFDPDQPDIQKVVQGDNNNLKGEAINDLS